uniref:TIM barrel protein n=1 Tax=Haloprofundus sp. MHR1 TaxID=2572921 RepID=UPI001F18C810|nr:TIM barrel protein [Haloprofundus sp. MHR1]
MVDFSVCIEMVYDDDPFHDRIRRAAAAGADAVEFWDWREKDLDAIRTAAAGRTPYRRVYCRRRPHRPGGDRRDSRNHSRVDFDGFGPRLSDAHRDHGSRPRRRKSGGAARERRRDTRAVAEDAEGADVTLVVEPLNTAVDHPGYFLTDTAEGIDIVREVDSPGVKLLYDVYHQQVTEGNVVETITENVDHIGHVHIADVPGRHEPGTGEIRYENVLAAIDDADYDGYVGCEFTPTVDPDEALAATFALD